MAYGNKADTARNAPVEINEAPQTAWKKVTSGMGKTFAGALGLINTVPTIFGGRMETTVEAIKNVEGETVKDRFIDIIRNQIEIEKKDPFKIAKKWGRTIKGDLSEIGTEKGVKDFSQTFLTKGDKLTTKQNVGATAASIALDILLDPLTYMTLGGSSALKIGGSGLTKAGTKVYAKLIGKGVAKGLTREVAQEAAEKTMTKMLSRGGQASRLFSEGGIRFADWIPKVAGESIVPYKNISKFVEPIGKYTGLGKAYKGLKNWELTKAVKKAVSTTAGVPEDLFKFSKKAQNLREYENIKEVQQYIKPLQDLGSFTNKEAEEIFNAIRKPELYTKSADKIKGAADIISNRFTDIRTSLVNRGVDVGWLDDYVPQLYDDMYGKEFAENIKKFTTELPGKAKGETLTETVTKVIEKGGLKRGKEFFEHPRTLFKTVEEAEAAGHKINKNIFDLLNAYESGATRIHAFMDLVDKVKPTGINLAEIAKAGGQIPEGYVKGSGMLDNIALPKDVASYLGSFQKTFFNNAELKTFLKYYDSALRYWKTMATVVSPGFHFRNFFSNIFNSFLGGNKNPLNYLDTAKALKTGTNTIVTQGGEKVTGAWIIDEFSKRGLKGGWFSGELGKQSLKETLKPTSKKVLKGLNIMGTEGYLAKGGKKFGTDVEEFSRLTHFIDVFKKTGDLDLAAEETFKYLFDYGDLTPFWKNVVNKGFPFGTWLRKNTALQFEQIIKQPAKYGISIKAKKLLESFSEAPDETYLPEWLKKEMAMRTPFKDSQGNFIYMRLDLPYLGIGDVTDWRSILGGITPAAKVPAELGFGKELFTGKPIERYPGYTSSVPGYIGILPEAIKKRLGVVRAKNPKTGKIEERMSPYMAYILRQNPLMSKIGKLIPFPEQTEYQTTSRLSKLMSILGGIGITPYDVEYRKKVYEKEQKQLLNTYKKRLEEVKLWK